MPKTKVFISYAREDAEAAERIYRDLKKAGVNAWLDKYALLPGQRWKLEIEKAIKDSTYFLALLSSKSVSKRGYVQKELKEALDLLDEFPESKIFLIPVRLDECDPSHAKLNELHRVNLFPSYEEGMKNILRVMNPIEIDWTLIEPSLVTGVFTPQPTIEIEVSSTNDSKKTFNVKAVIDTAAVMTTIPQNIANLLEPGIYGYVVIRGAPGEGRLKTYFVNLRLADIVFSNVEAIGIDRDYALLGLDVLKQAIILFDGPNNSVKLWLR